MKRLLSIGIVLFWLVMVGLLIRRTTVDPQSANTPLPSPPLSRLASHLLHTTGGWGFIIMTGNSGHFHRSLTPLGSGYQWKERSQMKLRVMNSDQNVHTEVDANIDQQYALRDFSSACERWSRISGDRRDPRERFYRTRLTAN